MAVPDKDSAKGTVWTSSVDQTIKIWKAKVDDVHLLFWLCSHAWWLTRFVSSVSLGGKNDWSLGRLQRRDLLHEVRYPYSA